MVWKSVLPFVASVLLAATIRPAIAQEAPSSTQSESEIIDATTGEVLARGEAIVEGVPGNATSEALTDDLFQGPGSRFASGNASIPGIDPGTASAESSTSGENGARSAGSAGEIAGATGEAAASSQLGPTGGPILTGQALGEAMIVSPAGTGAAVSGVTIGDISTGGGAATNLGSTLTSSFSEVSVSEEGTLFASTTASSEPLTGSAAFAQAVAVLDLERWFFLEPLLPDGTFSSSQVEGTAGGILGISETWKGAQSGSAFNVSHAETATMFTMGASGGEAGTGPTSSFSQAISVPTDGGSALFSSSVAESTEGLSTYGLSVVADQPGTGGDPDVSIALSVSAFDGNGLAHADALAGLTYSETDVSDAFDAEALNGVAFSITEALSPTADVDSTVRVEGDGTNLTRTALLSVDLESVQDLTQALSAIADNTVEFGQSLQGNTIIDNGGPRSTEIQGSGLASRGIISINQDAGNTNNQANIRSIAVTDQPNALLRNQVAGRVSTTGNRLETAGSDRSDRIDGSFAGTSGILGVNQSSGSLNQLNNVLALAIGIGGTAVAIEDTTLEAVHSDNTIENAETVPGKREDVIAGGSFDGFAGIAQVTQSAGDLNQITSLVSVSVTLQ